MAFTLRRNRRVYLDLDRESHHIQITGSTGSRKSSLIRRLVDQAYARGMCCVFLDLKREYLQQYYKPEVDWLIDPLDERCPRWMIGKEALDPTPDNPLASSEPNALALAAGAFPDEPTSQFFFKDHARGLLAYLLARYSPTTSTLAKWFANPEIIDELVQASEFRSTLSKNSPEQRNGILGTLNHLGRPMRWMPDEEGRREFSVREWAASDRAGSIFLSSERVSFQGLQPLQSLIFDLVLLNLMTYSGRPCLIVADEIGEFQRSPQLEMALSMMRGSGNPIILSYQSPAQLEAHYGDKIAEAMMNNPYYNIVLRQRGKSAETASKTLGAQAQLERARESRPSSMWGGMFDRGAMHGNYQQERVMESVVTAGEIEACKDGVGFLGAPGQIVKIEIPWYPPVVKQPSRIKRTIPQVVAPMFIAKPAMETKRDPNKKPFAPKAKKLDSKSFVELLTPPNGDQDQGFF